MASRMDRYKSSSENSGRSRKNQSLYDEIENLGSYSNIEGVATIEKANEIDIKEVKKLLKNRENYKKQRDAGIFSSEKKEVVREEKTKPIEKTYDINAILNRMKEKQQTTEEEHRKLSDDQYDFLKKLNSKNIEIEKEIEKEEKELNEVINTIKLSKKALEETDSGLFDDLKSDTMVGDASSIKDIIDEEKEKNKDLDDTETMQLDKSFYTSSFGFTKSDFEELKDINKKIKKSNKFIIFLLVLLILGIAGAVVYFMFLK